ALVRRMMTKDPEQRLPSAAAARHELLAWADKGPGLPLDRPEDVGFEQAVTRLETEEPSAAQVIADVVPAADEPSPHDEAPPPMPPEDEEPPTAEPVPEAIPVGIPAPPRRAKRNSRVVLPAPPRRPHRRKPPAPAVPPWLVYAGTIVVGMFLGLVVLVVLWLLLKK
ncbi:MAG TPA: hypothetical protein VFW33_22485, partial [Gemmataceae bacterium]|nr:hypothetical protein [Gemmataceae bacterium]